MAGAKWLHSSFPLMEGKAKAIVWAMQTAKEVDCQRLEIESDNSQVVSYINKHLPPLNPLGLLVEDIISLSKFFASAFFTHCYKETNEPTHYITRLDSPTFPLCIWMENVPPSIHLFVSKDVLKVSFHL